MSLFDSPKPFLNPAIWNPDNTIRPEVRAHILNLLQTVLPMKKIYAIDLLGSNVSYQYGETSDIDVNVVAQKGEMFEQWHTIFKNFNKKKHLLPGTSHPINYFFQEYDPNRNWDNSLGAYDLIGNKWVKNPIPFEQLGDPETKYEREISYGKILLTMIETQVRRAKEANARGDKDTARRIYTELAILFKQVEDNRKTAYRYRAGTPALQEYNIIYKLIESSIYSDLFNKLIDFYDEQVTPIKPRMEDDKEG